MPAPGRRLQRWSFALVLGAVVLAFALGGSHAGSRQATPGSRTVATTAHPGAPEASRLSELRHPTTHVAPHHLDLAASLPEPPLAPTSGAAPTTAWTPAPVVVGSLTLHPGRAPPAV